MTGEGQGIAHARAARGAPPGGGRSSIGSPGRKGWGPSPDVFPRGEEEGGQRTPRAVRVEGWLLSEVVREAERASWPGVGLRLL